MKLTEIKQQAIQARISHIVGAESYDRLFMGVSHGEVADRILYAFARTEDQAADIKERFALQLSIVATAGGICAGSSGSASGSGVRQKPDRSERLKAGPVGRCAALTRSARYGEGLGMR